MKAKVRNNPEFQTYFKNYGLKMKGVEGLGAEREFKLHVYLTEAMGRSIEYLVEVSLMTNIFLAISSLLVALLAHHFQVAFMYFLPGFVAVGLVIFALSYIVARKY